jgi:hypothetical protein
VLLEARYWGTCDWGRPITQARHSGGTEAFGSVRNDSILSGNSENQRGDGDWRRSQERPRPKRTRKRCKTPAVRGFMGPEVERQGQANGAWKHEAAPKGRVKPSEELLTIAPCTSVGANLRHVEPSRLARDAPELPCHGGSSRDRRTHWSQAICAVTNIFIL